MKTLKPIIQTEEPDKNRESRNHRRNDGIVLSGDVHGRGEKPP